MMQTIYSHTETESKHPGFISIMEEPSGSISVVVKRKGGAAASAISLSKDQLAEMVQAGSDHLSAKEAKPEKKKK